MNKIIKEIEEVIEEHQRIKKQKILYEGIRALDMALNTGRALTSEQLEAREELLEAFVESCYVEKIK
jgi:hypothetical protein